MLSKFWMMWFLFLCAQVLASQGSEGILRNSNISTIDGDPNPELSLEDWSEVDDDEDIVAEYELNNNGFEDVDDQNTTVSWEDNYEGIFIENQLRHESVFKHELILSFCCFLICFPHVLYNNIFCFAVLV